jgi:hypothetical protein
MVAQFASFRASLRVKAFMALHLTLLLIFKILVRSGYTSLI